MLKAGDRIGDWIIESPLGEGGMGAVFRVHSALSERVDAALKVMKPSLEPDARTRFVREAEALAALRHPAIVRVMGFSEDTRRGLLYLVMELAEGETLKRRLERGPMALPEALNTFVPLAGGLEHAHAAGISHRDLKPSNIILSSSGVQLVDFGIAAAEQSGELTGKGHLGTLSYLPPEVFRGENAFALGVKKTNPTAKVQNKWTLTWFDPKLEKEAAEALLEPPIRAQLITQHQDSPAAQLAAQAAGRLGVAYHADMNDSAPKATLTAATWNWTVHNRPTIEAVCSGAWTQGGKVIIAGSVSDDEAKTLYPGGWEAPRPYLRIVDQPK